VKSRDFVRRVGPQVSMTMLIALAATVQASDPVPQADQSPPASTSTQAAPSKTPVRMDPKHFPHIGSAFYPPLSVKNGEQGACYVGLFVESDGSVPAMQLLKSSGYNRLDGACFEAFDGIPMIPATLDGKAVAGWVAIPVNWVINSSGTPVRQPPLAEFSTPRLPQDYALQVGQKHYPESARAHHEEGTCVIEVSVGSDGSVNSIKTIKATGFDDLDHACIAAVSQAKFIPERQDGHPVPDVTYIAIYWHMS
jgi:TonB family protein